ncbi:hypothetical protein BZG36_03051 [Bifiguratus adelaidae]|uniref:Uncharacterized protein n=1 Tax=Bifiguratus adelaidae TaxID=1938954 RepID=A0A261XYZ2_9FUNG|nr:hypothetical protein BZG36_03051 [Bifiguratus adelaidae]
MKHGMWSSPLRKQQQYFRSKSRLLRIDVDVLLCTHAYTETLEQEEGDYSDEDIAEEIAEALSQFENATEREEWTRLLCYWSGFNVSFFRPYTPPKSSIKMYEPVDDADLT